MLDRVPVKPSFEGIASGAVQLTDIGGAGPKSLVVESEASPGLFPRSDEDGTWGLVRAAPAVMK